MARSLKTNYLLLALAVSVVLVLSLGGFAYYEHRINTTDANELTHVALEQKLETDLESRAASLSKITSSSLTTALKEGNIGAIGTIAGRLLDEPDIERVEVLDSHNNVLYARSNPAAQPTAAGPYVLQSNIRSTVAPGAVQRIGSLEIWMSRAEMQETLSSINTELESKQGVQTKRIRGAFAIIAIPLVLLGLLGAWYIARQ
jgi:hypothetical protein